MFFLHSTVWRGVFRNLHNAANEVEHNELAATDTHHVCTNGQIGARI